MIRKIQIIGFQSHCDSTLELAPRVNAIVGTTDSGKSAVLRGLWWLVFNRPSGEDFRRHGSKETEVAITLENGTAYRRIRSDAKNQYVAACVIHKALGGDVPKAMADALAITPLNWQQQMDAPFLLAETPGEVARRLNEVADLDSIDSTLACVASWARESAAEHKVLKAEQTRLAVDLEAPRYAGLDKLAGQVRALEARQAELRGQQTRLADLVDVLEGAVRLSEALKTAQGRASLALESVGAVEAGVVALEKRRAFLGALETLGGAIGEMRVEYKRVVEAADAAEKELAANWPDVCPLCGAKTKGRAG